MSFIKICHNYNNESGPKYRSCRFTGELCVVHRDILGEALTNRDDDVMRRCPVYNRNKLPVGRSRR